ncbi:hypothetical protein MPS_1833 [Mycobacterium pseudoshottsii JCM 15466]|nr:hypothetical protein MPS_1833 [Mycobacterium pseudoshottsii JCM 15466]
MGGPNRRYPGRRKPVLADAARRVVRRMWAEPVQRVEVAEIPDNSA